MFVQTAPQSHQQCDAGPWFPDAVNSAVTSAAAQRSGCSIQTLLSYWINKIWLFLILFCADDR